MLLASGRLSFAIISLFFISFVEFSEAHRSCASRAYRTKAHIVCVCNATFCDDFPQVGAIDGDTAVIITSSRTGSRFQSSTANFSHGSGRFPRSHHSEEFEAELTVDSSALRQTMFGFGGAFTDAAGENLQRLSAPARRNLLEAYYGKNGIEYTLGRVPMASCDFSSRIYSYCDVDGDFELANFNLTEEDHQLKIPFILTAQNLTRDSVLRLVGSPWSSPAWMKTTNRMAGGGTLRGRFNGRYYETWAYYFRRFIEEYKKVGIPIWAITTQNEPFTGAFKSFPWQTLYFSPLMQRDFIAKLLGPTLKSSSSTKNVKLIIHDDQRFFLPYHADVVLQDKTASRYVDGVGVHWYGDAFSSSHLLTQTHNNFPDKFILATEACTGSVPKMQGPIFGAWERAELYANSILDDVNNWASGWLDWNICLDERGGPNWAGNFVDAPIIVNSSGKADEFYKQPMYYAMGHFSKFIRPGSVRIGFTLKINTDDSTIFQYDDTSSSNDENSDKSGGETEKISSSPPNLRAATFLNPKEAQIVVVLLNRDAWRTFNVNLVKGGNNRPLQKALRLKIEPNTITTVLFQNGGDNRKRRTRKKNKTTNRAE